MVVAADMISDSFFPSSPVPLRLSPAVNPADSSLSEMHPDRMTAARMMAAARIIINNEDFLKSLNILLPICSLCIDQMI